MRKVETKRISHSLNLQDQILLAIRRITRAVDIRSRKLLQDYGLTAPQLTTLRAVSRMQPASASVIAKEIHLGQPTVTGILDRLERRGLIERTRGEHDRRSVNIALTDEGRRILEAAPSVLQDQFQESLARLQEWERTQILSTLQRIADMLGANDLQDSAALINEWTNETIDREPAMLERDPLDAACPPMRTADSPN